MERYIGLDVHAASCTAAVVDAQGKKLGAHVIETNGEALVKFLATQPGKPKVCMEEGTQSEWLYQVLSPHAQEVVVIRVEEKSSPRGQKNDELDAYGLADRHRRDALPRGVWKDAGRLTKLRQMVKVHSMIVGDTTRVKNRIKALYRSRGVNVAQKSVYSKKGRKAWLEKLPESSRAAIGHLYAQYDQLEEVRNQAQKELVTESHRHPISEILETCPGVGEIRAAQIIATVMVPERFRTRQQFWAYCGLGIVMRSSSDWIQTADGRWTRAQVQHTRGLNMSRNAMLKTVFKGAATSVLQQHRSSVLYADYARMVEAGTKPNLAKVTLARKIAATVLAMWKKKEAYDPAKRTSKTS
jgi:transposase